ncbi:contact-dependent growth inhibition system immunity protein, partial [Achromobacter arsenitoxydans]
MYPALNALLGGYFHQDYDLFGETIEEVALC